MPESERRILLAVTADRSLGLMQGLPEYLVSRGWEVHIVAAEGPRLRALASVPGVTVHSVRMQRDPSPLLDLVSLMEWYALVRRIRPQVVSAGTPKAGLLGMLGSRLVGVPRRTYHLRGLRLESATGVSFRLLRFLEKAACSCATDVLAVSPSLKAEAISLGLAKSAKVHVVGAGSPNGVNLQRFRPGSLNDRERSHLVDSVELQPKLPVIGFVGRITPDKGLSDLLAASSRLASAGVRHQLLLVGGVDGSRDETWWHDTKFRHRGAKLAATGRVTDTAPYYQLMDVLVLPSRREGLPNVALEAQASGIPVITTTATGARDSVLDGETGYLTEVGNIDQLTETLHKLLTNAKERARMGRAGRAFMVEQFDRERVWRATEAYYRAEPRNLATGPAGEIGGQSTRGAAR